MAKKVKYPGVLGRRSDDVAPSPPPHTVLGEPTQESVVEHEKDRAEWVQRQVLREFDGMARLLEHYQIDASEDRFLHLALALARDHVPYNMAPARGRGRPKTTQQFMPIVDALAGQMKSAGQPQSVVFEQFAQILGVEVETLTREVKRFRSEKRSGEKEI